MLEEDRKLKVVVTEVIKLHASCINVYTGREKCILFNDPVNCFDYIAWVI